MTETVDVLSRDEAVGLPEPAASGWRRAFLSGAASGALTAVLFAALHDLLISDIWFSLVPMMMAGALCGASLGASYRLLFRPSSTATWFIYSAAYVLLFVGLGVASVALLEPVTTIGALIAAEAPPNELFRLAAPLTVVFTLAAAGVLSALWGRTPGKAAAVLATVAILVLLFGLNVSVLGLVEMSRETAPAVAEFFGLIAAILMGNATLFWLLERNHLFRSTETGERIR